MEILIQNLQKTPIKIQRMRNLARRLLQAENCSDNIEVSIVLTDDENISKLNKEYRNIDGPTDVLSFSQIEGEEFGEDECEVPLGDVVISVETAKRQAEAQGHTLEEEIDLLLVHGLLHLLGYDHADSEDEEKMFARQAELLKAITER